MSGSGDEDDDFENKHDYQDIAATTENVRVQVTTSTTSSMWISTSSSSTSSSEPPITTADAPAAAPPSVDPDSSVNGAFNETANTIVFTVAVGQLPQTLTTAQEVELKNVFFRAVVSAGIPGNDVQSVNINIGAAHTSTADIRVHGTTHTNLAAAADVLLLLSFQDVVDSAIPVQTKAVRICRFGPCDGQLFLESATPCPKLAIAHFRARQHERGRREDVFYVTDTHTVDDCATACLAHKDCAAFQYRPDRTRCELSSTPLGGQQQQQQMMIQTKFWTHYFREIFCADRQTDHGFTTQPTLTRTQNDKETASVPRFSNSVSRVPTMSTSVPSSWAVGVSVVDQENTNFMSTNGQHALSKSSLVITISAVLLIVLILVGLAWISKGGPNCMSSEPSRKRPKHQTAGGFEHWDVAQPPNDPSADDWQQNLMSGDMFWDGNGIIALHEGEYRQFGPRPLNVIDSRKGHNGGGQNITVLHDGHALPESSSTDGTDLSLPGTGVEQAPIRQQRCNPKYCAEEDYTLALPNSPRASDANGMVPQIGVPCPELTPPGGGGGSNIPAIYDNVTQLAPKTGDGMPCYILPAAANWAPPSRVLLNIERQSKFAYTESFRAREANEFERLMKDGSAAAALGFESV